MLYGAREFYRTHPVEFVEHWIDTYDPRNAGSDMPTRLPFIPFKRQRDLVEFLLACLDGEASGLVEKCRDMGATWICCAFSVWLWLFWPGVSIGWGSRKEQLVDKIGVPDSIFQKMRMIVMGLPREFWPAGFSPKDHMTYMKFVNPETGATITGEAGDNIGRGGRTRIYFKDESAHYERPELIEAALADNTRVQIDISSVNGVGNVFHRRRMSGKLWTPGKPVDRTVANVFVMDWSDHPAKNQAWFDEREAKAKADGLMHVFEQEVKRNYSAAVADIVIPGKWVEAAIDAHKAIGFDDSGGWMASLDVADEGGDRNAFAKRKGVVLKYLEEWGEQDTGQTTRRAIAGCEGHGRIDLQYDCIGVGAGVKGEANRLARDSETARKIKNVRFVQWNAGAAVQDPEGYVLARHEKPDRDTPKNEDFFANLKAQGWWALRRRFEKTYRARTEGIRFDPSELISLPSDLPMLRQLQQELSQPTVSKGSRLKLVIDKNPPGTRSPNLGDAVMMLYFPCKGQGRPLEDWL
ncbi:TerL protein [Hyphomicrobium sp. CS1GBMeth3]|uniref:TerL protein n=1 Tax=Hyphomicrobium sp. CS1GBMeth3 TaxID=1892845 RepID=UPI001114EDC6|nr:TerL protein [Hyphomicrobium sp. CS1GBMeth3]